jgi:mRNA-degrading endonuclease toxin of MazEF toxin-antitoxin module
MVPFNDQDAGKDRPVVILGWSPFTPGDDHNIIVVPVYTFGGDPSKALAGDLRISSAASGGLSEVSFVRCRRLQSLHPKALRLSRGPLGTLEDSDLVTVLTEVSKMFAVHSMQTIPYGA